MVFLFEFPILAFIIIALGLLGINLIPIITFILTISLVISIFWIFIAENKLLNLITIIIHIILLIVLDDKKFYLWDILEWLF